MKKVKIGILGTAIVLFLSTGLLLWQINSAEKEKISRLNQQNIVTQENKPLLINETRSSENFALSALSTAKEGWGFVRNKQHGTPGISKHQQNLLNQYPAIFTLNTKEKNIVLTFDLGYEKGFTPKILDILKAHHMPATFFVTGPWLRGNPELSKRILAEGHVIGNHTMTHPSLPELDKARFEKELNDLEALLTKTTGVQQKTKFLRPPKGEYSELTLKWAQEKGFTTVFWSIALVDWKPLPSPQVVVDGVMANLHPGAVVLLHGVSQEVTDGLDALLTQIATDGYKVIPLDKVKT